MSKLVNLWNTEPAAVLGIVGSIAVFALEQFAGKGIITQDTSQSIQNLIAALTPFIVALVTRTQVSPS